MLDAPSTLGGAGFPLGVLASETISYRAWVRGGAAATADPGSHLPVPIARALTYSSLLWTLHAYGLPGTPQADS